MPDHSDGPPPSSGLPSITPPDTTARDGEIEDGGKAMANIQHETRSGTETPEMQRSQELAPPLPPRPGLTAATSGGSFRLSKKASRPQLLSQATTALSLADIHTQSRLETGSPRSSPTSRTVSRKHSFTHFGRFVGSNNNSEGDDAASVRSYIPTLDIKADDGSILGEGSIKDDASLKFPDHGGNHDEADDFTLLEDPVLEMQMREEFKGLGSVNSDGSNEDALLKEWKSKLKHFFILSASGKPIYSRHGDDQLISHYIGVAQTLIASFESSENPLKSFSAGDARFVMLSRGHLNLVATSRLGESTAQLRTQLESLYMQILSTLTLPSMEKMFSARPSTDLRRPLEGTDVLLDGLADGFTRGSPSTLFSALECLRLRKTDRKVINDALLAVRSPELLYGLVVAGGRLVSVLRPKKHSLHPSDLHLVFNMLFEAGSIKAGGGENWIPLCLPGFNNTGFVYMYVSFLPPSAMTSGSEAERPSSSAGDDNELAIIFISPSKEAFYSLRTMRDAFLSQLRKTPALAALNTAISKPRPTCKDLLGATVLKHFLYKSRGNVQFTMSSYDPFFPDLVARRKLISLYGSLHENLHSRTSHLKVQQIVSEDTTALAWETPLFELYCVAGPNATRANLAYGANRVVQWIRREEERVFIIGGAVF